MPDCSVGTTAAAVKMWPALDLSTYVLPSVRDASGKKRYVTGSGLQSFLEGMEYYMGDAWRSGHISLSPYKDTPHFDSAHLTIVGKNYFFDVDESGAGPGSAPGKFAGKFSMKGSDLPKQLQDDLVVIITLLAGTFSGA
ncbi:MAG: hypothetical protein JWL63_2437 [Rhodocyclales bacterium]|nr:hypothetical protein [Rhodocyclales bacterium]